MTAALIWGAIVAFFNGTILPVLVAFGGWIAAAAAAVLVFLFSPTIRNYTIGAIAIVLILAVVRLDAYFDGRASVAQGSVCSEFRQIVLKGKNDKSTIAAVRAHNDLGEKLGCWSNGNIR